MFILLYLKKLSTKGNTFLRLSLLVYRDECWFPNNNMEKPVMSDNVWHITALNLEMMCSQF